MCTECLNIIVVIISIIVTLYVSISMCNVNDYVWLYCIYYWQVPHPVVSVPHDGFMEYNKWMNEWTDYMCLKTLYQGRYDICTPILKRFTKDWSFLQKNFL